MPTLNPQQFSPSYGDGLYHGTFHDIEGDRVLPASKTGRAPNFPALSHLNTHAAAFATENEDTAWDLASSAQQKDARVNEVTGARTRVYRVAPHPEMEVGPYHADHADHVGENLAEWKAPHFDVQERIDIKPGQQGTFPNLNWNQFSKQKTEDQPHGDRYNHPDDGDIQDGHGLFAKIGKTRFPSQFRDAPGEARMVKQEIERDQWRLF